MVVADARGKNARRKGMAGEHRGGFQRGRYQLPGDTARVGRPARHVPTRVSDRHVHQNRHAADQRQFLRRANRSVGPDKPDDVSKIRT